jgi:hypothetical protein
MVDSLAVTELELSVKLNTTSDTAEDEPPEDPSPWQPGPVEWVMLGAVAMVVAVVLILIGIAVL